MNQIRVVIADDHAVVRSSIQKLLSRTDDIVVIGEATNGKEAVQLVEELKPDLLLLDMEMPVMTGPEVAAYFYENSTPTRILALSGYDDREYVQAMLDQGASGYLTKNQAPDKIVSAIRAIVAGEQIWFN